MPESVIHINGSETPVAGPTPLVELLRQRGIDPSEARGIAVAVNERIVRRGDWSERAVQPGDTIEIVTARQGG